LGLSRNFVKENILKRKNLILIISSILLAIVFMLSGCSQAPSTPQATNTATTPTPTQQSSVSTPTTPQQQVVYKDQVYNCVSPRGIQLPVTIKTLAPRIDTLEGKVVYVNQGEADPIIMPALWERVQKDYPKTTWKYIASSGFGPNTLEDEVKTSAKAVIRGIAW
jgi:hypothetical protein